MIPENEQGVVVLFSQQAEEAGFEIVSIQHRFPDAIIKHKGEEYRAEFEFKASNFIAHKHDPRGCDLIICWEDDSPLDFPLPILALSKPGWAVNDAVNDAILSPFAFSGSVREVKIMQLQNRAQFFAKVVNHLYRKQDIRGKLTTATRAARHLSLSVRLADSLAMDSALRLAEPLALATATRNIIAQRLPDTPGLVTYQFELKPPYWQEYTRKDVNGLGVGLGDSKKQVDFSFDPPHSLIAGSTGSGKSETARSILAGLMATYSPDDLGIIIVDPHSDFECFSSCSHLLMPIANDDESINRAIVFAGQELSRRTERSIKDGRRFLLAIDEAQSTLPRDRLHLEVVDRIAEGGRKYRINLLISTQHPTGKTLPMINCLRNRFIGVVSDARESAFVSGQPGLQAHKLSGSGDTIHVAGPIQERFQVALATEDDLASLPRGEVVQRPEIDLEDTPRIVNTPKGAGRPSKEIQPKAIAHYLLRGPEAITKRFADENLDLRRYNHIAHRDFSIELAEELAKLQRAMEASNV